VMRCY